MLKNIGFLQSLGSTRVGVHHAGGGEPHTYYIYIHTSSYIYIYIYTYLCVCAPFARFLLCIVLSARLAHFFPRGLARWAWRWRCARRGQRSAAGRCWTMGWCGRTPDTPCDLGGKLRATVGLGSLIETFGAMKDHWAMVLWEIRV